MRTKTTKEKTGKGKLTLLQEAKELLCKAELSDELAEALVGKGGELGFLLKVLKGRPRTFNPYLLKGMSVYKEPKSLDRKTAELVAVSAAAALHCEHCLEAHMARAVAEGATLDDIMDTILVAGAISESSMLSVAVRKYKQLEAKTKKSGGSDE